MPLKTLYAALGAALLVAGTVSTPAAAVEVKATATVPYEAGLFSKDPTDEEKARAVAEKEFDQPRAYREIVDLLRTLL